MDKRRISIVASLLSLIVATVFISLFLPARSMFNYDYEIGDKWRYETLYADFSFPILKTDEQIQEEMSRLSSEFIPYYRFSREVGEESLSALDEMNLSPDSKSAVSFLLGSIFDRGIIDCDDAEYIFLQKDKRALKYPVDEFYSVTKAKLELAEQVGSIIADTPEILDLVRPNLLYDKNLSNLVKNDSEASVSYTDGYVEAGKLIVSKDELITPEVCQLIDSYRKEFESSSLTGSAGWNVRAWYAVSFLVVLLVLFLVIRMTSPQIIGTNSYYYILLLFVIFNIAELVLATNVDETYLLLFPFTLLALLLQAFFSPKLVIPVYMVTLMPLLVMFHNGYAFFVLFTIAGVVSIFLFPYFNKGWKQFLLALIIFAILTSLCSISYAVNSLTSVGYLRKVLYLFIGSFLTVAGYPLVYLFERLFNLVSNSRLVEISDTSNPLLRKLEAKAPGTLQHSLQVMNMADYAARAIDANPLLVRAGALYHDIGKMNNPLCFVENESLLASEGDNKYHSQLTPLQSAREILQHVPDGVELARENHLPDVVVDFIRSHHGTAPAKYFYTKYLNEGGSEDNIRDFCYDGMKPRTKEQVILMLCDVIEAASRTLKEHTPEAYATFVHSVISGKLHDGQLDDAEISVRELGILEESLRTYLAQMHHERIVYPKRNNNK